mmetsp:Transcript_16462/g.45883  ORF Transcript_16462/g.45883 Transcript_16462/m.45883 type:complete len:323 (-) Transcript_16462:320-1288(-)
MALPQPLPSEHYQPLQQQSPVLIQQLVKPPHYMSSTESSDGLLESLDTSDKVPIPEQHSFVRHTAAEEMGDGQAGASLFAGSSGGLFGGLWGSQLQEFIRNDSHNLGSSISSWPTSIASGYLASEHGGPDSDASYWNSSGSVTRPAPGSLISPMALPCSSAAAARDGIHGNYDRLFLLSESTEDDSELPANLALGSDLLGLVFAEEEAADPQLPAFFSDAPVLFDAPLEDPSHSEGADTLRSLADTSLEQIGMDGSLWEQASNVDWSRSESATGGAWAAHEVPEAALMAAAGVLDDSAAPPNRERAPEDRELDALMATLACR